MTLEVTALIMAIMNSVEVIIIILIGLIIIFGAKKIPELAKSFGKATSEFEKARIEARRELHDIRNKDTNVVGREKLEAIAETLGIDYTNKNDDQLRFAIETEINKNKNK
ncbi:MAG TPA: twin-arginine translocase TatA/TatE family subunit [Candidatus Bathyarchaeia archaeon]|nr:twin-arginine translocase TatA/TatE family subunit [Candidatus Bathyarchaeia archaeon]